MANNINDLRAHLFDAIKGLKDGSIDIEKAKAMSDLAQVIVNSAKVEVDYAKATGSKGSGFLEKSTELPNGITGVHVHRMK
jgi:Cu/Zn superoxide dismutase